MLLAATRFLFAGAVACHVILALGCFYLGFCSLIGSKGLVALLAADDSLVIEVLHTTIGLLGYFCSCHSLLIQLIGSLDLLLSGAGIGQVFKGFGGLIGGFQHLLLRFHLWYFQDGKGVAYMHIVAFLDAKFYNSAWQLAGYSVF